LSSPAGPVWSSLRQAAAAFVPTFEVEEERPDKLAIGLRKPGGAEELRVRYRSERGLFLRTYYLVVEADIPGAGPPEAGKLVLRRRKLAWKGGKKSRDAKRWSEKLSSRELDAALARLQIESLSLAWEPTRATWRFALETLSGSVTVTFFPPLMTPNPFERDEAEALVDALGALRSASARTRA
jgi:hypothetical protein